LYVVGIDRVKNDDHTGYVMASSEKALCDKLVFTRNLNIKSQRAMDELLFDDLRIDEDSLARFDRKVINACIAAGEKTVMLRLLLQLVTSMHREAS